MRFITLATFTSLIVSALAKPISYAPVTAIAYLVNATEHVTGTIEFTQNHPNEPTQVTATIYGLAPNTKHGFHIHEFGDLSQGCTSLGPHFNPFNKDHGSPFSDVRHVGDFGNIEQKDGESYASIDYSIDTLQLTGPNSVIGRGIVLHADEDDLGLGDSPLSKTVGNSGARLACGIIGFKFQAAA